MIYRIKHKTSLEYAAPVANARFNLRLLPRLWDDQRLHEQSIDLAPNPQVQATSEGPYWVQTTRIGFGDPIDKLTIATELLIENSDKPIADSGPSIGEVRAQALAIRDLSVRSPAPYLFASRIAVMNDDIAFWAAQHLSGEHCIISSALSLNEAIYDWFAYELGATSSDTTPETAFLARKGVCQDFAHVMIIALRSAGIPAAYVSGYLLTVPPPGKEKLVGADAMHAWVNVWCGKELGWVGFDPTNNCLARGDHIPIGMGRDYADVSPIDGTFIGSAPQKMKSAVDVVAIE